MELIVIGIIVLGGALVGMLIFKTPKYSIPTQKTRLLEMLSSVNSDIRIDKQDSTISPENIAEIQTSILYLTSEIEDFSKNVQKNGSDDDRKFTLEIIEQFHQNLESWIQNHEKELKQLENVLSKVQENSKFQESGSLDGAKKRLEIQISNYQKIRT